MPTEAKRTQPAPDAPDISTDFRFAMIPEALLFDPDVDHLAVRLYGALVRHGDVPGSCYPSHDRLAALVGVAARSVQRPLRDLERAGWVTRYPRFDESGRQLSSGYWIRSRPMPGDTSVPPADPNRWVPDPIRHEVPGAPAGAVPAQDSAGRPAPTSAARGALDSAPKESKRNESNMNEMLGADAPSDPPVSLGARQAADRLADRIEKHTGTRPRVTARWTRDLDLLIRRGPLHADHPEPVPLDRVLRGIDFVFDRLAEPEGRRGFCWADQIRSGTALRDHWLQILDAGRRMVQHPAAQRQSRVAAALAEIDAEDRAFEERRQAIPALAVAR